MRVSAVSAAAAAAATAVAVSTNVQRLQVVAGCSMPRARGDSKFGRMAFQTVPRSKTGTNYRFSAVSAGFQLAKVVGFVQNLNFSACEFQAPAPDWLSAMPSQKQRPKFRTTKPPGGCEWAVLSVN